ncbi:MAG TPA: LysE family translocator [Roseiarcus sp.]|nr:LysE family translocator [Roseiarcus sp.]
MALAAFAFVAAITPGPNNLMLMTSGVKYGFGRTLPHLIGVILGFALMIAVVGFGLDVIFERFPIALPTMRVAGSLYMLWLALRIALARPIGQVEPGGRPIGFFAAAGFQWVNPKAWVMALSALSTYAGIVDDYSRSVLLTASLCGLIAVPCSGAWALFGASLSRVLRDPRVMRPFNWTMAALLVASIAPTLFE